MHFSTPLFALISTVSFSLAAPTQAADELFLPDGLPTPSAEQLRDIERRAHGTLPGLRLPATISAPGVANLQLMTFGAFQDVAFFNELIRNVTQNVTGYVLGDGVEREYTLRSLEPILAVSLSGVKTEVSRTDICLAKGNTCIGSQRRAPTFR